MKSDIGITLINSIYRRKSVRRAYLMFSIIMYYLACIGSLPDDLGCRRAGCSTKESDVNACQFHPCVRPHCDASRFAISRTAASFVETFVSADQFASDI
jgi:hypothetical protein